MSEDTSPENLRKFLESDDPAMVRMGLSMVKNVCKFLENNDPTMRRTGLSMAKDCGVPEELWKNIFGLLMKDPENREAARELAEEIGMRWYLDGTRETLGKTGYWSRCLRGHSVVWYRRRVEPLITVLGDEDWRIRQFAAETLGKIGDKRAVEPLIKALSDDHRWVRIYAVGALRKFDDKRTVEPFIGLLSDEDGQVRHYAAKALGELGDARAGEPLIKALGDGSRPDVSSCAAEALGKIGDTRAVEPLITALGDEDAYVRDAAKEALKKLGHEVK